VCPVLLEPWHALPGSTSYGAKAYLVRTKQRLFLGVQDDLEAQRGSAALLGLDSGLEELLLAMQKNITNQVPLPDLCKPCLSDFFA
jgi:hypothetical protein